LEESKVELTMSRIDSLINEEKDDEIELGDNVNSIVQDILNTYNDNLLNKYVIYANSI